MEKKSFVHSILALSILIFYIVFGLLMHMGNYTPAAELYPTAQNAVIVFFDAVKTFFAVTLLSWGFFLYFFPITFPHMGFLVGAIFLSEYVFRRWCKTQESFLFFHVFFSLVIACLCALSTMYMINVMFPHG
ncbi:MAG: hypothetical protein KBD15_03370 [Candidatus Magasanikbacteria bacterium]|nr:hypothetical protein [Candidatus Magasanikbacteria bacterium]